MAQFLTINDVNINKKRVLIREDFNVPIADGVVQNDLRIRAALPGIQQALRANAQVILMSHLGRPEPGHWQAEFSLQPIAACLSEMLNENVKFIKQWPVDNLNVHDKIVLLENVRFLPGETENSPDLAKQMAALCDVFVMDAFGSAHRAHASTVGVAEFSAQAVAGPLLTAEVEALDRIMQNAKHPVVAIIGGAKVSTKFEVLQALLTKVDTLIVGGGMANTLLAAQGNAIGASLWEPDLLDAAKKLLSSAQEHNCKIVLPTDVVTQDAVVKNLQALQATDQILDIGPATVQQYAQYIASAATILWNGPMGVFENPKFANGTMQIADAIARSQAFSVAGGGDTLAAIENAHLTAEFSYISTGGGAFLEYIEGKRLPAIEALITKR